MQKSVRLTDEALVASYAEGSNEAFDILLNRYRSKIFSYIFHIVKNQDVADDIFQETFVKIIMTIKQGRYVETGKFSAWVTRIARNLVIDYFRQEKSENLVSIDNDDVDLLNRRDLSDSTIEDNMVQTQICNDIRRLIHSLPDSQRNVIEMRFYQNMSFKEIADATNVSINTALGRMRYALMHIRKLAKENNIALTF
ncbi:MAG: sigma-70 family RNA polymerase sigma factor [Bacteroidales bacterium]|nr:sigma-70 family RNA polymerase sigma factor [Bacteroidales bacterium]